MDYEFKIPPFSHQLKTFNETKDLRVYALFWEQGTGKTKEAIDRACYQYLKGWIDCVLIVAKNGVHRNWAVDEIPTHAPDKVMAESFIHYYQTSKAHQKAHEEACERALDHKGLVWICMSYDAFMTVKGKEFAKKILKDKKTARKVFYIADESKAIKTPGAKRTKTLIDSSPFAESKMILEGTPVGNKPFDVFSQIRFLDKFFWHKYGWSSFTVFKKRFGIWETGYNGKTDRTYDTLVAYQDLPLLYEILKSISSRVLKEDVLDLPPKLYTKRYFELTKNQAKLYNQLSEEMIAFLDSGDTITAPLAIVKLLRLQQVVCGYVPVDSDSEEKRFHLIDEENARLKCLMDVMEDVQGKTIIWARFTKDIDLIMDALAAAGRRPVRYDGSTKDADRAIAIARFQGRKPIMKDGQRVGWEEVPEEEQATDFVANADAAGEGLTLHAARTVIYYNNSFKLTARLQSEDRAHRIGQEHPVQYVDIIAQDTIDEEIVAALRLKKDVASIVLGDEIKKWL